MAGERNPCTRAVSPKQIAVLLECWGPSVGSSGRFAELRTAYAVEGFAVHFRFGGGSAIVQRVFGAPWKIRNHLLRWLLWPRIRVAFLVGGVRWGRGWKVFGTPILQRHLGSTIQIGDGLDLRSTAESNPLTPRGPCVLSTRRPGARIVIGRDCGFTGAVIVAESSIEIGNRVLVGSNTVVVDTDFHPLDHRARADGVSSQISKPVRIDDDVFVGTQALILKGVTIGRGAIVGAGSVVTRDVPAWTIVAGNPARPVGRAPGAPEPA